ncbi:MAG: hypothetical protein F6K00_34030 [Leptolyngbya sp. SIOISBB]|nr:hypothetical protein [Leptolyngbya sp. SIOISBB]
MLDPHLKSRDCRLKDYTTLAPYCRWQDPARQHTQPAAALNLANSKPVYF